MFQVPSPEHDADAEARLDEQDESSMDELGEREADPAALRRSRRSNYMAPLGIAIGMGAVLANRNAAGKLPDGPLRMLLILFFVVGPFLIFLRARKLRKRRHAAPIERKKAVVVAAGDTDRDYDLRKRNRSKVVLKMKKGNWRTLRAPKALAASLKEGDVGVAFLQANTLIEFRKVAASLPGV